MPPFCEALRVLTVSDRAFRGDYPDKSGPRAAQALASLLPDSRIDVQIVADGIESVVNAINQARKESVRVVITVGGTGIAPRDMTPEASAALITQNLDGIAEAIRREGERTFRRAIVSRGLAGVVAADPDQECYFPLILINLAGSENAAEVGCRFVAPLLPHLVKQLDGGDNHEHR